MRSYAVRYEVVEITYAGSSDPAVQAAVKLIAKLGELDAAMLRNTKVIAENYKVSAKETGQRLKLISETKSGEKVIATYTKEQLASAGATKAEAAAVEKLLPLLDKKTAGLDRAAKAANADAEAIAARNKSLRDGMRYSMSKTMIANPDASITELEKYRKSYRDLIAMAQQHGVTQRQLKKIIAEADAGVVNYVGSNRALYDQAVRLKNATAALGETERRRAETAAYTEQNRRNLLSATGRAYASLDRFQATSRERLIATSTELMKYNRATTDYISIATRQGRTLGELNAVMTAAQAGTGRYTGEMNRLYMAAVKVQEALRGLGAERRKSTADAVAQREAAKAVAPLRVAGMSAPSASTTELARYQAAVSRVQAVMASASMTAKDLATAQRNIASGTSSTIPAMQRLQTALLGVNAAQQSLGREAKRAAFTMGISWGAVFKIAYVQMFHRAIANLSQAFHASVKSAGEFQMKMSEIRTISQENQLTSDAWASSLRRLSSSYGIEAINVAEAAYQALSNQIAKGSEVIGVVDAANRLAITTYTDSAVAMEFRSSVMNTYGMAASSAAEIMAKAFKTAELGRVRIAEMANTLGRSIVPAQMMGVTLDEMMASISMLTIRGIRFSEAQTLMRNIMNSMIKPSKEMARFFREIGVDSGEAAIKTYGFARVMAMLEERTKGSTSEIGKYFTTIRSRIGGLAFASAGLDMFNDTLGKITNSTQSFEEATRISLESNAKYMQIQMTAMRNIIEQEWGQAWIDASANIVRSLGGMRVIIDTLARTAVPALALALGVTLASSLTKLYTAMEAYNKANTLKQVGDLRFMLMKINPLMVTMIAAFGALAWSSYSAARAAAKLSDELQAVADSITKANAAFTYAQDKMVEGAKDTLTKASQVYAKFHAEYLRRYNAWVDAQVAAQKRGLEAQKSLDRENTDLHKRNIDRLQDQLTKTKKFVSDLQATLERLSTKAMRSQEEWQFQFFSDALLDKTPKQQLTAIDAQIAKQRAQMDAAKTAAIADPRSTASERYAVLESRLFDLLTKRLSIERQLASERKTANEQQGAAIKRLSDMDDAQAKRKQQQTYALSEQEKRLAELRAEYAAKQRIFDKKPASERRVGQATFDLAQEKLAQRIAKQERVIAQQRKVMATDANIYAKRRRDIEASAKNTAKHDRDDLVTQRRILELAEQGKRSREAIAAAAQKQLDADRAKQKIQEAEQTRVEEAKREYDESLERTKRFDVKDAAAAPTAEKLLEIYTEQTAELVKQDKLRAELGMKARDNAAAEANRQKLQKQITDQIWEEQRLADIAENRLRPVTEAIRKQRAIASDPTQSDEVRARARGSLIPLERKEAALFNAAGASKQRVAALQKEAAARAKIDATYLEQYMKIYEALQAKATAQENEDKHKALVERLTAERNSQKQLKEDMVKIQERAKPYFQEMQALLQDITVKGKAATSRDEILAAIEAAQAAPTAENIGALQNRVSAADTGLKLAGGTAFTDAITRIIAQLQSLSTEQGAPLVASASKVATELEASADRIRQTKEGIEKATKGIQDLLPPDIKMAQGLEKAAVKVTDFAAAISKAIDSIKAATSRLPPTPTPTPTPKPITADVKRTGGTIYAARGKYARGFDTVPAMLSPGEFVINANSARKFYGQLVGMNATPKSFRTGGPITNVTGNWNINMTSGGSAGVDGRAIVTAIKRELRRGTVRL